MKLLSQQKIRIGACAWSFDAWQNVFYPADLPPERWLEFYSKYFPTVEIDSTFYGVPSPTAIQRWLDLTPGHFRFSCKMPREITHQCRLRDCTAELKNFLQAIEPLSPKLHVILIQLSPSFRPREGKAALRNFVEQLPTDFRFAIEFRDPAWHQPQVIHLLEKHHLCWVWSDTSPLNERNLAPFEFQPRTTDFLYVRLLGDYSTKYDRDGKHLHQYGKLLWKREAALESWSLKIERALPELRSVSAYVNNHFEGFALETAQRLAQRLGFELDLPAAVEPDRSQLDLFRPAN